MKSKKITVTVNGDLLEFDIDIDDFNQYQGDAMAVQNSIVDASHNFLVRTVSESTKPALTGFLKNEPGAAVEICTAVIGKYKKPLKIELGN